MRITEDQLRQLLPRCEDPAGWVKPLNDTLRQFKIEEPKEVAAFLAQIAVESGDLNRTEENLRYSAARVAKVWPSLFKTASDALRYAYNPQMLACKVYAGKNGNGSERTGDGYQYRGRGLLQITGRSNYKAIGDELGYDVVNFPDALLERRFAALSAGAYWKLHVQPGKKLDVKSVTKAVTGSATAIDERKKVYAKALEVLNVSDGDTGGDQVGAVRASHSQKAAAPASTWL